MVWQVNRGRRSLLDEKREGRPESVAVPDAVRKVNLADHRLVTHCEIKITIRISGTRKHTLLPVDFNV